MSKRNNLLWPATIFAHADLSNTRITKGCARQCITSSQIPGAKTTPLNPAPILNFGCDIDTCMNVAKNFCYYANNERP